jgi:predicted RNase H-like HicB family nuclease
LATTRSVRRGYRASNPDSPGTITKIKQAINAVEVLELLVEEYQIDGKSLPKPKNIAENLLFA